MMRPYTAVSWVTPSLAPGGEKKELPERRGWSLEIDGLSNVTGHAVQLLLRALTHEHPVSVFVENRKDDHGISFFRLPQGD